MSKIIFTSIEKMEMANDAALTSLSPDDRSMLLAMFNQKLHIRCHIETTGCVLRCDNFLPEHNLESTMYKSGEKPLEIFHWEKESFREALQYFLAAIRSHETVDREIHLRIKNANQYPILLSSMMTEYVTLSVADYTVSKMTHEKANQLHSSIESRNKELLHSVLGREKFAPVQ
jgi:hypothetical protein